MKSVYSAVRTGSLNKAVCASYAKVKIGLEEAGWGSMDWIHLAGFCECRNEFSVSVKCGEFLD